MFLKGDFKYLIEATLNGVTLLPNQVEFFFVKKMFLEYRFPVYILALSLFPTDIQKIMKGVDPENPHVVVDLFVFYHNGGDGGDEKPPKKLYELKGYTGLINTNSSEYEKYMDEEIVNPGYNESAGTTRSLTLGLFNPTDIRAFSTDYVNNVYKNYNIDTFIAHIADQTSVGKMKFIFSPSDNKKNYEIDFISPMGFYQVLEYVDKEYGLYDTRYNIYIDDSLVYLLNSNPDHKIDLDNEGLLDRVNIEFIQKDNASKHNEIKIENGQYTMFLSREATKRDIIPATSFNKKSNMFGDFNGALTEKKMDDGKHNLYMVSNTFLRYIGKQYNQKMMDIKIGSYPVLFAPYTDVYIEDIHLTGKYRVSGYVSIFTGVSCETTLTVFQSVEIK